MAIRNLAREHFERTMAAQRTGDDQQPDREPDTAHESVMRVLASHKARLKSISSIEKKIEYKHAALPDILPWVEGALAADRGAQDPVVAHALPWLLDVGDYAQAWPVAEYVLRHGLKMPDEYQRPPATVIAEVIADDALKALDTQAKPNVYAIAMALDLTAGHDMHDQVRAKLHKAAGLAALPADLPTEYTEANARVVSDALAHLNRAFELNTQVGVKKPIEQAKRWMAEYNKRLAKAGATPNTTESAGKTGAKPGVEVAGPASAESGDGGEGQPPPPAPDAAP
jgi:hypothetical protein